MNCRKVRNFLSSYVDGELNPLLYGKIARHLSRCASCRKQELDLRMLAVAPFKKAERLHVPDHIWSNIRNAIINRRTGSPEVKVLERIFTPFLVRKPILAFITVTLCILIAVVFIARSPFEREDPAVTSYLQEQLDFISRLSNGGPLYNGNGSNDFGTSIEEFLL